MVLPFEWHSWHLYWELWNDSHVGFNAQVLLFRTKNPFLIKNRKERNGEESKEAGV